MPVPPIGLILPTVEVARTAQAIADEMGIEAKISCHVGNHMQGLAMARRLEEEGVEVLISRRSTADLIEAHLKTPNISISITLQDMAQVLMEARSLTQRESPRIGLFAMASDQTDIEAFARHLNFNLRIYTVTPDEEYLALMVERAIADKMDVIVAGTVVAELANQRRVPSLVLGCGTVALRTALLEAEKVAYARKLEKVRAEHFRAVFENAHSGILVLDKKSRVHMANPAARRFLNHPEIPRPCLLRELLPELHLEEFLEQREPVQGMFLSTSHGPLVVDVTPISVSDSLDGVVVSFEPAEPLSELGAVTKKNLYSNRFSSQHTFASIVGNSPQIVRAKRTGREYAESSGTVLIFGETGTGKELFANAIHAASAYRQGPFVPVNCAALPPSLLDAELFGYEEGAFTGATRKGKPGLFEMAHQGTIFLDEISELGKSSQMRLLRVLQERQVMRLGGTRMISLDIRVIAATNKNLYHMVREGRFREDLFYRISALPLRIPPLREREGDVGTLARHMLAHSSPGRKNPSLRLRSKVLAQLESHAWPGNVRELQNVMERLIMASRREPVLPEQIPMFLSPEQFWGTPLSVAPAPGSDVRDSVPNLPAGAGRMASSVPDFGGGSVAAPALHPLPPEKHEERERIIAALSRCGGHRGRTATLLGMDRSTLFRKISAYGIRLVSV